MSYIQWSYLIHKAMKHMRRSENFSLLIVWIPVEEGPSEAPAYSRVILLLLDLQAASSVLDGQLNTIDGPILQQGYIKDIWEGR